MQAHVTEIGIDQDRQVFEEFVAFEIPPFPLQQKRDEFVVETFLDEVRRIASDDAVGFDVFGYNGVCGNDGSVADRDASMITHSRPSQTSLPITMSPLCGNSLKWSGVALFQVFPITLNG